MNWLPKNKYYQQCGDWTICKYGGIGKRYGLFHGKDNKGYFDDLEAAKQEYRELVK